MYGYREKGKRYSKHFEYWSDKLRETDLLGSEKIINYQEKKLQELVKEAFINVPYYQEIFKDRGLLPKDIKSVDDLKKLPILTKEDINSNTEKFINQKFSKKDLIGNKTSGTTGKSLKFYTTKEALSFQWAVWWRHRSRFDFNFGDKHLNFTGKLIVPNKQSKPPYWRWNHAFNQGLINMQSIRKGHIDSIINHINESKYEYWTGYPSIIHYFCNLVIESEFDIESKPKAIFLGAENVYERQKEDIHMVTDAVITDQYGFTEGAANASQCEYFNHHIDYEFGIIECVDPEVLDDGRVRGRIVCTGFANHAFPFIRYDVGDIGIFENEDFECPCGRKSPVIYQIEGRTEDYVITPEGNRIMRFDYIFKDTSTIKEAQVLQEKEGEITINIVKRENYLTAITEAHLRNEVAKWISPNLKVRFAYLSEIPREPNGKFRAVKSILKNSSVV